MLKLDYRNKALSVKVGENETANLEQLEQMKQHIQGQYDRENDPAKRDEYLLALTQANSAIKAIKDAQTAISGTILEEAKRKVEQRNADLKLAAQAAEDFQFHCVLIAQKAYVRFTGEGPHHATTDEEVRYYKRVGAYGSKLMQSLSYEDARRQAAEIMDAEGSPGMLQGMMPKSSRPWQELIVIPKPQAVEPQRVQNWFK